MSAASILRCQNAAALGDQCCNFIPIRAGAERKADDIWPSDRTEERRTFKAQCAGCRRSDPKGEHTEETVGPNGAGIGRRPVRIYQEHVSEVLLDDHPAGAGQGFLFIGLGQVKAHQPEPARISWATSAGLEFTVISCKTRHGSSNPVFGVFAIWLNSCP